MTALTRTRTRSRTTRRLSGMDLPECFRAATAASEARLLAIPARRRTVAQRRDLRRVRDQARRVGGAL